MTTSWVCMLSWFDIVCSILATVERESNVLEKELEPEFTYTTKVVMLGSAQLFLNCKAGTDAAFFAAVAFVCCFSFGELRGDRQGLASGCLRVETARVLCRQLSCGLPDTPAHDVSCSWSVRLLLAVAHCACVWRSWRYW